VSLDLGEFLFKLGNPAIGQFSRALIFAAALRVGEFDAQRIEFALELLRVRQLTLFRAPARSQGRRLLLEIGKFLLQRLQAALRAGIAFLLQRFLLDLEPDDFPVHRIELFRLGIDLHLQPRRRFVHQVDGLVGQEAVGDVAVESVVAATSALSVMRTPWCCSYLSFNPRRIEMVSSDRRLVDIDRLEPPRQRRVLLDVLLVFIQRSGADTVQFAACQRGF